MPRKIDLMARAEMVRMRSNPPETPFMRYMTNPTPRSPVFDWSGIDYETLEARTAALMTMYSGQSRLWKPKPLAETISLQEVDEALKKPDIYVGPTMARKIASKARPITLKIDLDPDKWGTNKAYTSEILRDLEEMIDAALWKGDETDENS